MGSKWRRQVAAASLVVLGIAACGGGDVDEFARANFEREESDETTTTVDQTEGIDLDGVDPDDQDDVIIEASLEEIEAFWADQFATVSRGDFEPVSGGFIAYGPDREVPSCGQPQTYEDVAQNAFYCPINDVIAWDTDNLTGALLERFGPFSLVIVMAHEYGHAIQFRGALDTGLATIAFEQQADCFAGAFTGFVNEGGSDVLNVSVDDLDLAVAGFLSLRDPVGTPTDDPDVNAHGSAFDRVGAFQDGFLNGTQRCAEYEDIYLSGDTTAIPLEFTEDDFETQGNAPFDPREDGNIFDLTLGSLETFWTQSIEEWDPLSLDDQVVAFSTDDPDSLPECPGIDDLDVDDVAGQAFTCFGDPDDPTDDFIAFDIDLAAELYGIGDFAVSGIISQQYAFVAQAILDIDETSKDAFLQADCFSGAWTGEVTFATLDPDRGGQELLPDFDEDGEPQLVQISAGDLDEAVASFLLLGEGVDPDEQGTAFERVAAFRDGFLNGLDGCEDYLDGGAPGAGDGLPQDDED